ncbi:hypothetical protein [Azospirillum griseum]|uniref:Uncharacterized protein n=1 Tax=Azospirillum griseum TaxID=2496639 RepID=A0A3S0HZL3_9PROT|nr:hypothetical protein [Azospirillum griseum]RTR22964.1 hypothetical protein EJ903_05165 [Azospirillum griseum]
MPALTGIDRASDASPVDRATAVFTAINPFGGVTSGSVHRRRMPSHSGLPSGTGSLVAGRDNRQP